MASRASASSSAAASHGEPNTGFQKITFEEITPANKSKTSVASIPIGLLESNPTKYEKTALELIKTQDVYMSNKLTPCGTNSTKLCYRIQSKSQADPFFQLQTRQDIAFHRFVQYCGDQKGILLMHSVGTGKTLTSLSMALNSFSWNDSDEGKRTILLVIPSALFGNFKKELQTKIPNISTVNQTDEYTADELLGGKIKSDDLLGKIKAKYNGKDFIMIGYKYGNFSEYLTNQSNPKDNIKKLFKDKIVIFDESHRLFRLLGTLGLDLVDFFIQYKFLNDCKRFILMTGTPYSKNLKDTVKMLQLIDCTNSNIGDCNNKSTFLAQNYSNTWEKDNSILNFKWTAVQQENYENSYICYFLNIIDLIPYDILYEINIPVINKRIPILAFVVESYRGIKRALVSRGKRRATLWNSLFEPVHANLEYFQYVRQGGESYAQQKMWEKAGKQATYAVELAGKGAGVIVATGGFALIINKFNLIAQFLTIASPYIGEIPGYALVTAGFAIGAYAIYKVLKYLVNTTNLPNWMIRFVQRINMAEPDTLITLENEMKNPDFVTDLQEAEKVEDIPPEVLALLIRASNKSGGGHLIEEFTFTAKGGSMKGGEDNDEEIEENKYVLKRPILQSNYKKALNILGVDESTPFSTVRQIFKKLALQKHPNKGGIAEKWVPIQNAFTLVLQKQKGEVEIVSEVNDGYLKYQMYQAMVDGIPNSKDRENIIKSCMNIATSDAYQNYIDKNKTSFSEVSNALTKEENVVNCFQNTMANLADKFSNKTKQEIIDALEKPIEEPEIDKRLELLHFAMKANFDSSVFKREDVLLVENTQNMSPTWWGGSRRISRKKNSRNHKTNSNKYKMKGGVNNLKVSNEYLNRTVRANASPKKVYDLEYLQDKQLTDLTEEEILQFSSMLDDFLYNVYSDVVPENTLSIVISESKKKGYSPGKTIVEFLGQTGIMQKEKAAQLYLSDEEKKLMIENARKNQIQTGGVHTQEEIKQVYSKLLENIEMLQNEEIISDTPLVNAVNEYKQNVINLYEGLQTNKNNVFFSEQIQKINTSSDKIASSLPLTIEVVRKYYDEKATTLGSAIRENGINLTEKALESGMEVIQDVGEKTASAFEFTLQAPTGTTDSVQSGGVSFSDIGMIFDYLNNAKQWAESLQATIQGLGWLRNVPLIPHLWDAFKSYASSNSTLLQYFPYIVTAVKTVGSLGQAMAIAGLVKWAGTKLDKPQFATAASISAFLFSAGLVAPPLAIGIGVVVYLSQYSKFQLARITPLSERYRLYLNRINNCDYSLNFTNLAKDSLQYLSLFDVNQEEISEKYNGAILQHKIDVTTLPEHERARLDVIYTPPVGKPYIKKDGKYALNPNYKPAEGERYIKDTSDSNYYKLAGYKNLNLGIINEFFSESKPRNGEIKDTPYIPQKTFRYPLKEVLINYLPYTDEQNTFLTQILNQKKIAEQKWYIQDLSLKPGREDIDKDPRNPLARVAGNYSLLFENSKPKFINRTFYPKYELYDLHNNLQVITEQYDYVIKQNIKYTINKREVDINAGTPVKRVAKFDCPKFRSMLLNLIFMKTGRIYDAKGLNWQPHLRNFLGTKERKNQFGNVVSFGSDAYDLEYFPSFIEPLPNPSEGTHYYLPLVYSSAEEMGIGAFAIYLESLGFKYIVLHDLSPGKVKEREQKRGLEKTYKIYGVEENEIVEDIPNTARKVVKRTVTFDNAGKDKRKQIINDILQFMLKSPNTEEFWHFLESYIVPLIDKSEPICLLLHPDITEGVDAKHNPAILLMEPPNNFGDYEQLCGRVLRTYSKGYMNRPTKMVYQYACYNKYNMDQLYEKRLDPNYKGIFGGRDQTWREYSGEVAFFDTNYDIDNNIVIAREQEKYILESYIPKETLTIKSWLGMLFEGRINIDLTGKEIEDINKVFSDIDRETKVSSSWFKSDKSFEGIFREKIEPLRSEILKTFKLLGFKVTETEIYNQLSRLTILKIGLAGLTGNASNSLAWYNQEVFQRMTKTRFVLNNIKLFREAYYKELQQKYGELQARETSAKHAGLSKEVIEKEITKAREELIKTIDELNKLAILQDSPDLERIQVIAKSEVEINKYKEVLQLDKNPDLTQINICKQRFAIVKNGVPAIPEDKTEHVIPWCDPFAKHDEKNKYLICRPIQNMANITKKTIYTYNNGSTVTKSKLLPAFTNDLREFITQLKSPLQGYAISSVTNLPLLSKQLSNYYDYVAQLLDGEPTNPVKYNPGTSMTALIDKTPRELALPPGEVSGKAAAAAAVQKGLLLTALKNPTIVTTGGRRLYRTMKQKGNRRQTKKQSKMQKFKNTRRNR